MIYLRIVVISLVLKFTSTILAQEELFKDVIDVNIPHISSDRSIRYDYDIVYVRALRAGDEVHKRFYPDFSSPVTFEAGADLMLLHPDGSEEVLVAGGRGSITDPVISFDGQWVYYSHVYDLTKHNQWNPPRQGADLFKIHLATRKIVRLTNQQFSPNTGAAEWSRDFRTPEKGKTHIEYGVFNMGPCPMPDGRIAFTSNRDGFRPAKGYPAIALQLFVMNDRDESIGETETPENLEKIGHLNISGALHPVAIRDGRIMFSSLESQGIRGEILWGVWTIHPDGTNWAPLVSAFDPGGAPNGFHFQTQLSDGSLVIEEYYNQNNSGFGAYIKMPPSPPGGYPAFGPAFMKDPRNKPWRYGRFYNAKPQWYRMPFMPTGSISLTPFTHGREGPAGPSNLNDKGSPHVGKFTHPSGAPDNHLLTVYSPGPVNHQYKHLPQLDGGIYLIKNGDVVHQPSQIRLIKNDPRYNECWPRAVVPYQKVYGVESPEALPSLVKRGQWSQHLPDGSPFGLVGASSFYKRESYPGGVVPEGQVTAVCPDEIAARDPWKGLDAFTSHGNGMPVNFHNQGGDVGLYQNEEIHAVRILAMEPTTDRHRGPANGKRFFSHARERLRILGEIPLRKFDKDGNQPLDPDGNPDTSFLAKIPADTAFTFQTIDQNGLLLNYSQTWHQLRPGEIRNNCGGCHSHSQAPTPFEDTFASQPEYQIFDLTQGTPLVTSHADDSSGQRWDQKQISGLRWEKDNILNVEYYRDIQPILKRSCVACHSGRTGQSPAANLDLDADEATIKIPNSVSLPGTYYRLAADEKARYGFKPVGYDSWGYPNASRYIRKFQARRSLLVWKIFGDRLDGFLNEDHPSESSPGAQDLVRDGEAVDMKRNRSRWDLDYQGKKMPPPEAVESGKVKPLTDKDRRTLLRWIDLGCPIDLDFTADNRDERGFGWMCDDNRPIVALVSPRPGLNSSLERIRVGIYDYYSGLEPESISITADFSVDGIAAGRNLITNFRKSGKDIWEWQMKQPIRELAGGKLFISVRDQQGNRTLVERTFSVAKQ